MARATFLNQVGALLKRNIRLKLRNRSQTGQEIIGPIYYVAILILVRILTAPKLQPAIPTTTAHNVNTSTFPYDTSKILYATPDNADVANVVSRLASELGLTSSPAYQMFATPADAEASFIKHSHTVLAGIDFAGSMPQDMNYTIRVASEEIAPTTTQIHWQKDQCRADNGLQNGRGCMANTYLFSGFSYIQLALDSILIQMSASSGLNVTSPKLSVQLFTKGEYKSEFTVLQVLSSIYFVLAYSTFLSLLLVNLVSEKQNKIKESMRMMGMRDSAFWFSWSVIYAVIILVVTAVVVLIAWAGKFFENSNMFIFYIILALYGMSIINLSFALTPFFSRADTAGGLGSLFSLILSMLFFVVFFTKDTTGNPTIPNWGMFLLCLLSPLTLSLCIDQAIILDVTGGGMNFTTINNGVFPLSYMMIMLAVDTVLYGLIAFYLDSVIPNEYGMARPPWFFLSPSFWCPKKAVASYAASNMASDNDEHAVHLDTDTTEAIPAEFRNKNMLRIFDMHKTFRGKKPVQAVRGISLDIYEGQITALLGHNGAGKTTLIHMLTGMSPATSGHATIYGLNVCDSSELTELRTMIGLCPQHNILFDSLSPQEHLEFYGILKGVDPKDISREVKQALEMVDLADHANAMSSSLSGGQKRKLCVAIALIGDPKVVFLDEPTAGMDPASRRHLWQLLKEQQHDKLIVLTTHFMDEADILADRKAIINKGRLQCVGSSLFLKNRFGIGYHLNMVLEPWADTSEIANKIKGQVPEAEANRHHGKELIFTLPIQAVSSFPDLFGALEEKGSDGKTMSGTLGIYTYGVSMTTLEEVFLKLGEEAEAEEELENGPVNENGSTSNNGAYINRGATVIMENNGSNSSVEIRPATPDVKEDDLLTEKELRNQRIKALVILRLRILSRNIPKFIFQVVFPLIFILLGCVMLRFIPSPKRPLPIALKVEASMYVNSTLSMAWPDLLYNDTDATGTGVTSFRNGLANQGLITTGFVDVPSQAAQPPHYSGLLIKDVSITSSVIASQMTILYNDVAIHAIPATINAITSALWNMTGGSRPISTTNNPWPRLQTQAAGFNGGIFGAGVFFGIAINAMAGGLATNIVRERLTKAKSQLRLAGVTLKLYWGTVFALDVIQIYFVCCLLVILILAFQIQGLATGGALLCLILDFIIAVPATLLFGYTVSYGFSKFESAQAGLPNLVIWTSMLPYMIVTGVDMVVTGNAGVGLHYAFSVLCPSYNLLGCIYFATKVHQTAVQEQATDNPSIPLSAYFDPSSHVLITLLMPIVHIVLFYFLLKLNEVRSTGGHWKECLYCGSGNRVSSDGVSEENSDIPDNEDSDITDERDRVSQSATESAVIKVKNLRKEFKKKSKNKGGGCCQKKKKEDEIRVAVRNSSFLVEPGEVLGLLGPNGAGKTTTLNMIIAEAGPTRGSVSVSGYNVHSNMSEAFQFMGYCPQHDALWDEIYLRDHLEVYAACRGIPQSKMKAVMDYHLDSLSIREHANKPGKGLSGGTKRKLSYIMGMLGDPKVVLMDEPSTGMDPKSKRFLWDTISAAFNNNHRGALLTTHYMEEADALCTRVAIMINGQMECIGSTQHLKNKYGGGYHLEIKLKRAARKEEAEANMQALDNYIKEVFEGVMRQEVFGDRAQYRIPQVCIVSLSETFRKLEQCKADLNVEEYSFSQATLEQVFLEFAKNQVDEGDITLGVDEQAAAEHTRSLHQKLSLMNRKANGN